MPHREFNDRPTPEKYKTELCRTFMQTGHCS
jgi:hypothetical protein